MSTKLWELLIAWSVFLGVERVANQFSMPAAGIGVGFALVCAITGMAMVWML